MWYPVHVQFSSVHLSFKLACLNQNPKSTYIAFDSYVLCLFLTAPSFFPPCHTFVLGLVDCILVVSFNMYF